MNHTLFLSIALMATVAFPFDHTFKSFGRLLSVHVCNGSVDYAGISAQAGTLSSITGEFESVTTGQFSRFTEKEQLAFLINAYNFYTLLLIVKHMPLKNGIRDIEKPWDTTFILLFGKKVSLNYIEHELLRKKYREPRIHFGLVCASKGCPQLPDKPFSAAGLDVMLDASARLFLADTSKNRVRADTVYLSQIFEWFGADFTVLRGGMRAFVAPLMNLKKEDYIIRFLPYDWSLNNGPVCP
ncbi:MAG: DUF547 domain-containing protein [Chitinivibrionales bacterium]|nr:DUF547 domain-containing protein [Chitinivibrionales bacterium]